MMVAYTLSLDSIIEVVTHLFLTIQSFLVVPEDFRF